MKLLSAPRRALFLILCALTLASPGSRAEQIVLRIHHFLGADSVPHMSLIEPWARRVEADSKGRLKVEIYPAMGLGGKAGELVDQARQGEVDVVWTAAAYTPGRFPRSDVFSLPLVHAGDPAATNLAIMALMESELKPDFPGLRPLLVHVHQGHAFHMSGRPVVNVAAFPGLTLRPPGLGIGAWTIESLGAETTKKRHPKLPKAMQEGKLDGALMSFNLAESMGVIEASTSHTLLGEGEFFGTSLFLFLMNEERYQALPEDLRRVIDDNSGTAFAREMGEVWRQVGDKGIATGAKRGNRFDVLQGQEREQARALLEGVIERWLEQRQQQGIDGARLIDLARQAIARQQAR